jgi:hypothetical protein
MHGLWGARSDDTNTFKTHILQYVIRDITKPLDPSVNANEKIGRGFHHPQISRILLPLEWRSEDLDVEQS